MESRKFSLEELEKHLQEYFKEGEGNNFPFMKNTKWKDEEGNKYSSWQIGENLHTGDGGAELFNEALKKAFKDGKE